MTGGLGEPKFEVDGQPFMGGWGRPQRDGPPLRALSLIPYANFLLDRGWPADNAYVREKLYDPTKVRTEHSAIKNDLEYTAHRWKEQPLGFDLWEEARGTHFFTLMVSRKALVDGARLAEQLGDPGAARYYHNEAQEIGQVLRGFWSSKGFLRATLEDIPGSLPVEADNAPPGVRRSLDCAVPLAIIHGSDRQQSDSEWSADSDKVLATLRHYVLSFDGLYPINGGRGTHWTGGWAVGRYAEDVYNGNGKSRANPW